MSATEITDADRVRHYNFGIDTIRVATQSCAVQIVTDRLRGWTTFGDECYLRGLLAALWFLTCESGEKQIKTDDVIACVAWAMGEPEMPATRAA